MNKQTNKNGTITKADYFDIETRISSDIEKTNQYTSEIMELIDQKDELTQSDLQGAVMGIVVKILTREEN